MKLSEFVELVKPLIGKELTDIAYHHFNSPPTLPFAAYMEIDLEHFQVDDKTVFRDGPIRFEIYTKIKNEKLEEQIREIFKEEVWEQLETEWLPTENCFMTVFYIY